MQQHCNFVYMHSQAQGFPWSPYMSCDFRFDALPAAELTNFIYFVFISLKHIPSAFPETFRADGLVVRIEGW